MRFVSAIALICTALSLILLALRIGGALSFSVPLQVITSGWEQESLVALWEWVYGGAIYVSPFDVPYRWSVYNWLFYVSYGTGIEIFINSLSLSDAWIPTIGRILTFAAVVIGVVLTYHSFATVLGPWEHHPKILYLAFAVLVMAGPLVGFWAISNRPDIGALVFEIAAVTIYWHLHNHRPLTAILVFCLLAYTAWAFKQTAITATTGLGLYLLLRRDWKPMFLMAILMVASWSTTLALGPSAYVKSILMMEYEKIFSMTHMFSVFINFASKFVPSLLGATAVVFVLVYSGRLMESWRNNEALAFATSGALAGALLVVTTTPLESSAENYYFTFAYFLTLLLLAGLRSVVVTNLSQRLVINALTLGWVIQSLALIFVLFGLAGVISVYPTHVQRMVNKACLDTLERPTFVADRYLSLPWMTPGTTSFVLGYGYNKLRTYGQNMEKGGIGGLIEDKYFATLALPLQTTETFDGGRLIGYLPAAVNCPPFKIFLRAPSLSGKIYK